MTVTAPKSERNRLITKIHVAKKVLKFEDEEYRELLREQTGKNSCKDMNLGELNKVLNWFKKHGFVTKVPATARKEKTPIQLKILALWGRLIELQAVKPRANINTWIKRQCGCERLEWLDDKRGTKIAEALKQWIVRVSN